MHRKKYIPSFKLGTGKDWIDTLHALLLINTQNESMLGHPSSNYNEAVSDVYPRRVTMRLKPNTQMPAIEFRIPLSPSRVDAYGTKLPARYVKCQYTPIASSERAPTLAFIWTWVQRQSSEVLNPAPLHQPLRVSQPMAPSAAFTWTWSTQMKNSLRKPTVAPFWSHIALSEVEHYCACLQQHQPTIALTARRLSSHGSTANKGNAKYSLASQKHVWIKLQSMQVPDPSDLPGKDSHEAAEKCIDLFSRLQLFESIPHCNKLSVRFRRRFVAGGSSGFPYQQKFWTPAPDRHTSTPRSTSLINVVNLALTMV